MTVSINSSDKRLWLIFAFNGMRWGRKRAPLRAAEAFYMSRMCRLNHHPVNKGQEAGSVGESMEP